jgi:hypothetical protein
MTAIVPTVVDLSVDFFTMDWDFSRPRDAQLDLSSANLQHRDLNRGGDEDRFSPLARQYQHVHLLANHLPSTGVTSSVEVY